MRREKVAFWSTKAAISLKRVNIYVEETLLCMAYRNSPTLFRTVPTPTPYGLLFPKIGGSQPLKTSISLLSRERAKLRTSNLVVTFTGFIRTKADLKFWRKRSMGVSRAFSNFLSTPIISGTGKATNFKFCTHIHRSIGTKAH